MSANPTSSNLTRRSILQGGLAVAGASWLPTLRPAQAQMRGVPYGGAIQSDFFDDDPAYVQAFVDHCDMIVPMNELKFLLVHPERDRYDFSRADRLVDFAIRHGKTSRGHTFVWHSTNPGWLEALSDPRELERVLLDHIGEVASHFAGRLLEWDVVNEVLAHDPPSLDEPLRDTFWLRALGPRHIPLAFQAAARGDPSARLVINEYDLEFVGARYDLRRAAMLDIVRQLQDNDLRVDAVGLQAHLYAHQDVDVPGLQRFFQELKALGVGIVVTELDVIDFQVDGGVAEQDAAAYKSVSDLLDALEPTPPSALVAWGFTDRYNWVEGSMPRDDGNPTRPLPFDTDLKPKAWYPMLRQRLASMQPA